MHLNVIDFHFIVIDNQQLIVHPLRLLLKRGRKHNSAVMSVEISISCVVNGYHLCPFKVKEGEVFSVS